MVKTTQSVAGCVIQKLKVMCLSPCKRWSLFTKGSALQAAFHLSWSTAHNGETPLSGPLPSSLGVCPSYPQPPSRTLYIYWSMNLPHYSSHAQNISVIRDASNHQCSSNPPGCSGMRRMPCPLTKPYTSISSKLYQLSQGVWYPTPSLPRSRNHGG